jgi:PIN domain nuclease of toxin-antitoxin system
VTSTEFDNDVPALLLLDTHMTVWLRDGSSRLKPAITTLIEEYFHNGKLCVSPISAWEIGLLVAKGRLDLGQAPLVWFAGFVDKFSASVLELTTDIAIKSSFLPGKFHGDPADRMLVATAIANSAALVTADKELASYGKKGFVKIIAA